MSTTNPVTNLVTALTGKMNIEYTPVTDIIEINGDETYQLDNQTQIVRILSGSAWITINAEDRILAEGEETFIETSRQQAIISSLNQRLLVFEIEYL